MKKEEVIEVHKWISVHRGSTWECVIFFGIEHRLRKEEMEEQFNRRTEICSGCSKNRRRRASNEDRERTSGGVFIAVDSNLGTVVGARGRAVASIPSNEGRITQAGLNVRSQSHQTLVVGM